MKFLILAILSIVNSQIAGQQECLRKISANNNLQKCGGISQTISNPTAIATNEFQANLPKELDSICSGECSQALTVLATDLQSRECAGLLAMATSAANGIRFTSQDLSSLLKAAVNLICVKDGNTYCISQQLTQYLALYSASLSGQALDPAGLSQNLTLVCSNCALKQTQSIENDSANFSAGLKGNVTIGLQQLKETQKKCPAGNGLKNGASSSSLIGWSGLIVAGFLSLF